MVDRTGQPAAERLSALLETGAGPRGGLRDARGRRHAQTTRSSRTASRPWPAGWPAAGVRRGDRVALTLPNGPEFVQIILAATLLGAAAAPLNPAYTETEFAFYLEDIAPRLLLVPAAGAPRAAVSAAGAASVPLIELAAGARRPAGAASPAAPPAGPAASYESGEPDDIALVLHTSGTTSRPKQVPLRQRNLMASARTIAAALPARRGRRVVLRHAAVPHPRPGRLGLRGHGRRAARSWRRAGSPRTGSGPRPASTAPPGCRPGRRCTR